VNYVVIFAGGVGKRMYTSSVPKQFIEVDGIPIIIHSILNFEKHDEIDGISVVCIESWLDTFKGMLQKYNIKKVKWVVPGADSGQKSIFNGLNAIYQDSKAPENDIVLISDGVRPFVSAQTITENINNTKLHRSSVTVCPVPETIVEVNDEGEINNIPDRSKCYLSKAPQGFYINDIMDAHHKAISEGRFDCTNSAELMKRYGYRLFVVNDSDANIKVTTPTDIAIMQTLLDEMNNKI
jgi:2-C-methyl-D-erythritol 4-phosphate cytidylyltransferase